VTCTSNYMVAEHRDGT